MKKKILLKNFLKMIEQLLDLTNYMTAARESRRNK